MNPQVNNGGKGVGVFIHIPPGDDTYCGNGY